MDDDSDEDGDDDVNKIENTDILSRTTRAIQNKIVLLWKLVEFLSDKYFPEINLIKR